MSKEDTVNKNMYEEKKMDFAAKAITIGLVNTVQSIVLSVLIMRRVKTTNKLWKALLSFLLGSVLTTPGNIYIRRMVKAELIKDQIAPRRTTRTMATS